MVKRVGLAIAIASVIGIAPSSASQTKADETVIEKDTVLPVAITSDLNTASSKVGQKFTARMLTKGVEPYAGLPFGTVVYGTVKYLKRLEGNSPGLMELSFDGIETPSGNRFPIKGQLIDLKSEYVFRGRQGPLTVIRVLGPDRVVFTGYGSNSRRIVGVSSKHSQKDSELPKLIAAEVGPAALKGFTDEVQLPSDSQFGVLLQAPLKVPKGVM